MKTFIVTIVILLLSAWGVTNVALADRDADQPPEFNDVGPAIAQPGPTFLTIDITIDPQGQSLGAFQFEMTSPDPSFSFVGVEAGEHDAFNHGRPPYFDPIAIQGENDRLILAEYAKPALDNNELPTNAVRVATVYVVVTLTDDEAPEPLIQLTLTAAGNADGERIDAKASYSFRTLERPQ